MSECPPNSVENRNNYFCEKKDFLLKDNLDLILICCCVVLLSLVVTYFAVKRSHNQNLRQIPKKTGIDRSIENNWIYMIIIYINLSINMEKWK